MCWEVIEGLWVEEACELTPVPEGHSGYEKMGTGGPGKEEVPAMVPAGAPGGSRWWPGHSASPGASLSSPSPGAHPCRAMIFGGLQEFGGL